MPSECPSKVYTITDMDNAQRSFLTHFPGAAINLSQSFFGVNDEVLLNVRRPKKLFGNMIPRETGFYHLLGNDEKQYTFGNETWTSTPAPPECEEVAILIRELLPGTPFNTVVAQVYEGKKGAIAFHADDENVLKRVMSPEGKEEVATIVSVSFGASCKFSVRPIEAQGNAKRRKTNKKVLNDGDVLVMNQGFQEKYHHGIQKGDIMEGKKRICLTFREQV